MIFKQYEIRTSYVSRFSVFQVTNNIVDFRNILLKTTKIGLLDLIYIIFWYQNDRSIKFQQHLISMVHKWPVGHFRNCAVSQNPTLQINTWKNRTVSRYQSKKVLLYWSISYQYDLVKLVVEVLATVELVSYMVTPVLVRNALRHGIARETHGSEYRK